MNCFSASRLRVNRLWVMCLGLMLVGGMSLQAEELVIEIETPMAPPQWALLERQVLKAQSEAGEEFFARYFDERGYLLCVERWGGDDGPDDAIENLADFPMVHALGGSDKLLELYLKAWEGHLRQYTLAKTTEVPFAKDGMYYKEFATMIDWLHHGEGFTAFNLQGLSNHAAPQFEERVRRYAAMYMGDDPGAPNYDKEKKLIRSMFNGSRGPMLRKATGLDWAGDPIEVQNRFKPRHGEHSYEEMVAHFKDYNDVAGDHPLNLLATSLGFNAYALTGEKKYREWLLEYVDAWGERMKQNGGIIPSNVGLDGAIGGAAGGKWYGGVYGWGFTVFDPGSKKPANRNIVKTGFIGFMNAYLLTGEDKYLEPWRKQMDLINAQAREKEGQKEYPTMYGEKGWYGFGPTPYTQHRLPIAYLSQKREDIERVEGDNWMDYLQGKQPGYPVTALEGELERVRKCVSDFRGDDTTPDTRLADDPMAYAPVNAPTLVQLMLGGLNMGHNASPIFTHLRYFDPEERRAGVPEEVAVLVEKLGHESAQVRIVNVSPVQERELVVQAGGYAEHEFTSVEWNGKKQALKGTSFQVRLAPGTGGTLVLGMKRFVHRPTMAFPWERN